MVKNSFKIISGESEVKDFSKEHAFKLKNNEIFERYLYMEVLYYEDDLELENLDSKFILRELKLKANNIPEYVLVLINGNLKVKNKIEVTSGKDNNVNLLITGNVEVDQLRVAGEMVYIDGNLVANSIVSDDFGNLRVMGKTKVKCLLDYSWKTMLPHLEADLAIQTNESAEKKVSETGIKYNFIYRELENKLDKKFFNDGFFEVDRFIKEYLAGKIKL